VQTQGAAAVAGLVEASIPFVRFRVEKTLAAADTSSAEGKDAAIDELRPAFAPDVLPPSALREELVKEVAERLELAFSLASSWLAAGAPRRVAAAPGNGHASLPEAPPGPDAQERAFLEFCIALPDAAEDILQRVEPEHDFATPLLRGAYAYLLRHLRSPGEALPADEALRSLIAELTLKAQREAVTAAGLEEQFLALRAAGAKRKVDSAPAGEKEQLARRHQELLNELRVLRDRSAAARRR
jgi:DNA primase